MSAARAAHRREARRLARPQRQIPMVPGVIPDRTEASVQLAMRQAHEELPPVPGTQVCLTFFEIDKGLEVLGRLYDAEHLAMIRDRVAATVGDQPTIVCAYRDTPRPAGAT